ncbi:MAG: PsiF family protein [Burkholderiales bacterium]|nr:PsiF family protein [Burkholderiales bacterium]
MRKLAVTLAAALFAFTAAHAADQKKELTEQQKRMADCNAEAKKRTFKEKAERDAFMSACLKGEMPAEKKELTAQQQRMADCNAEAKTKKFASNDERQAFMSACLKGEKPMTQQERMTYCNKEAGAKNLKGDERQKFMSSCLKG